MDNILIITTRNIKVVPHLGCRVVYFCILNSELFSVFIGMNGLMFGAMILENPFISLFRETSMI